MYIFQNKYNYLNIAYEERFLEKANKKNRNPNKNIRRSPINKRHNKIYNLNKR